MIELNDVTPPPDANGTRRATSADTTSFDRTTAVRPVRARHESSGGVGSVVEFAAELDAAWLSLIGIHGGYLTAIVARAAESVVTDREVRTLTTNFQRAGRPGPARVTAREQRRGRSLSVVDVRVEQDDRDLVVSRITMLEPQPDVGWTTPLPVDLPPLDTCDSIIDRSDAAHFRQAHGVLDPSSIPFTAGPNAMVRGYVRPLEPRPIDAAWLAMITDWFPPPAFVRVDPPIGGISIDLTTHIHRTLPTLDDEWLTGSFEIQNSSTGLAIEHGRIVTLDGTVLAESVQTRWSATHGPR